MGHKEKIQPISYLAPRTELSAERNILGVILRVKKNTKKSVLRLKVASYPYYDWQLGLNVLCCLLTGQPLELNRTSSA